MTQYSRPKIDRQQILVTLKNRNLSAISVVGIFYGIFDRRKNDDTKTKLSYARRLLNGETIDVCAENFCFLAPPASLMREDFSVEVIPEENMWTLYQERCYKNQILLESGANGNIEDAIAFCKGLLSGEISWGGAIG
jgi:hypothetical protein